MSSTSDGQPHDVALHGGRLARLAVVLSGWPRISETFALNELLALAAEGMLAAVFATKEGDRALSQPGVADLDKFVTLLPAGSAEHQAAAVARQLAGTPVSGVHGYFAHRPAAVAELAAAHLGVPFGFSAHALDVRKVSPSELARRARAATVVVVCNTDVAATLRATGAEPRLVGHGVDVGRFAPASSSDAPGLRLLSVGRLVEKKGFDVLVDALALIDDSVSLTIVGDGPQREQIVAAVDRLGLGARVQIAGRSTHAELPAAYTAADVVVVPSRIDGSDDRDGLPNVVLEAMASGRPVVASDVAAIGTAVRDGVTGLLVPPDDAGALAAAIVALHDDPLHRYRLARAARADVVAHHELGECAAHLVTTLDQAYG